MRVNASVINHDHLSKNVAKSKSYICTISLGEQVHTTRAASTDHAFSGSFSVLWRESVIFAMTNLSQVLDVKIMSSSPFAPDGKDPALLLLFCRTSPRGLLVGII